MTPNFIWDGNKLRVIIVALYRFELYMVHTVDWYLSEPARNWTEITNECYKYVRCVSQL
jgi:hypothetical protein